MKEDIKQIYLLLLNGAKVTKTTRLGNIVEIKIEWQGQGNRGNQWYRNYFRLTPRIKYNEDYDGLSNSFIV